MGDYLFHLALFLLALSSLVTAMILARRGRKKASTAMTWNYRVVRRRPPGTREFVYAIHETHYDENGKIWAISQEPMHPMGADEDPGEALSSLGRDMEKMAQALRRPVVNHEDVPEPGSNPP